MLWNSFAPIVQWSSGSGRAVPRNLWTLSAVSERTRTTLPHVPLMWLVLWLVQKQWTSVERVSPWWTCPWLARDSKVNSSTRHAGITAYFTGHYTNIFHIFSQMQVQSFSRHSLWKSTTTVFTTWMSGFFVLLYVQWRIHKSIIHSVLSMYNI